MADLSGSQLSRSLTPSTTSDNVALVQLHFLCVSLATWERDKEDRKPEMAKRARENISENDLLNE
jgi:hypothetical protein